MLQLKESGLLGGMADCRGGTGKIQDEPGAFCSARKYRNAQIPKNIAQHCECT